MKGVIRLPLLSALGLVIGTYGCFTAQSFLDGQRRTTKYGKSDLQNLYVAFLTKEGYAPSIDRDGDVQFKFEGGSYFIGVQEKDPKYFRLVFPNFWRIESERERRKVLIAANDSTAKVKCAKVFMLKDNVHASVEIFVNSPEDFKPVFRRSISAIRAGVRNFVRKMQE